MKGTTFVGLDAHKEWISVAMLLPGQETHRPRVGTLARRRRGQPARVIALADRAMQRLYRRYVHMTLKGVPSQKATVAIARELVGFVWAALSPLATASRLPLAG